MSEQPSVPSSNLVRYSEILRQQVLDSHTLESLGKVDTLWMYPQINRVLGIICKPKLLGAKRLVVKLPQLQSVKAQILIEGPAEETTAAKVDQLESLIGISVWSEDGDPVGQITDCLFDLNSGVIIRYLMVPEGQIPKVFTGFTEGIYLLSPKQIRSFSRQRVLIAAETVSELRWYSEGLRLKLAQMSATLKQEYWDGAAEEWDSFSQYLQSVATQAKETFLTLAEKAKAKAQVLSQNFTQTVTEQVERLSEDEVFSKVLGHQNDSGEHGQSQQPSSASDPEEDGPRNIIQNEVMDDDIFDAVDSEDSRAGVSPAPSPRPTGWDSQPDPWDDWDDTAESDAIPEAAAMDSSSLRDNSPSTQPQTTNDEEMSQTSASSTSQGKPEINGLNSESSDATIGEEDPWIV